LSELRNRSTEPSSAAPSDESPRAAARKKQTDVSQVIGAQLGSIDEKLGTSSGEGLIDVEKGRGEGVEHGGDSSSQSE
jgi:hypothetical protein